MTRMRPCIESSASTAAPVVQGLEPVATPAEEGGPHDQPPREGGDSGGASGGHRGGPSGTPTAATIGEQPVGPELTRAELVEEFFRTLYPDDFQLALPVKEHKVWRLLLGVVRFD